MGESEIEEVGGRYRPRVPPLNSKSQPPALFDGTPRLYISLTCPYAQRVWIARNYKGLENIELVAINLADKPSWYIQRISASGKVPMLEHNRKLKGESLELLQYIDNNFSGPRIFPLGSAKREATKDLLKITETLNQQAFMALKNKNATKAQLDKAIGPIFDQLEGSFGKFSNEGPYFLGLISGVDFAFVPFIERFKILFHELLGYNILDKRIRLSRWLMEIDQVEAYTSTKAHPRIILDDIKKKLER